MKRILLVWITLLLSVPAITSMRSDQKQHSNRLAVALAGQTSLTTHQHSIHDDQLQEAVPHKTPRSVTTPRRRFINSTVEFFANTSFLMSALGWGVGQKLLPTARSVFNFLGGEAAFLFRLTPF